MPTERFQFPGADGQQLAATLDTPEREIAAYALFAHCFTCGKDVLAAKRIAVALAAKALRYCGSTSRDLAPARAISPIPHFHPTSPISCVPPIICAKHAEHRRS